MHEVFGSIKSFLSGRAGISPEIMCSLESTRFVYSYLNMVWTLTHAFLILCVRQ
jgi:hypothetical protein